MILGYLAGVSSRQPDLGSGAGGSLLGRSLLGAYGGHNYFGSTCVGVLIRMEDISSPWSETEWIYMLHRTFVHTTSLSVGIGPGRAWHVRYHTCCRIGGSVAGRLGVDPSLPLSAPRVATRGHVHSSGTVFCGGLQLRPGCRVES